MKRAITKPDPQAEADAFNAKLPMGSEVDYTDHPGAAPRRYRTRSAAEVLSGHTAVVWLDGKSGCVACSHCTPPVWVTRQPVLMNVIEGAGRLDPVRFILEEPRPGALRLIVSCFDRAWHGYWGGIGTCTGAQFLTRCDAEYIVGNLVSGYVSAMLKQHQAQEQRYLTRIVAAIQSELRRELADQQQLKEAAPTIQAAAA